MQNYDRNNNQMDLSPPIYFGSLVSGKMRSISGQSNMVSKDATAEINYAKANGSDWYTEFLADRLLLQDLLVMMARSTSARLNLATDDARALIVTPLHPAR